MLGRLSDGQLVAPPRPDSLRDPTRAHEPASTADHIDTLERLVGCWLENNPNEDAADGVRSPSLAEGDGTITRIPLKLGNVEQPLQSAPKSVTLSISSMEGRLSSAGRAPDL